MNTATHPRVQAALEAERAVLGSILLDNDALLRLDGLDADDFETSSHRSLYRAIWSLHDVGDVADVVTLAARLAETGELERVGGAAYLARLTVEPGSAGNVEYYSRIVRDAHRRREAERKLTDALERLRDGSTVDEALDGLETLPAQTTRRIFTRLGAIQITPPQWLVRGLLERETLACVFGAPGSFKSFLSVAIAASVSTGTPFRDSETVQGPVAYVAGEGHAGLRRRFRAWEIRNGIELFDAPLFLSAAPVPFGDPTALRPVVSELDAVASEHGAPKLVVVDTLSRNFAGDENSSVDMPSFIRALDALRSRFGSTVLVVHHSGHSATERSRGHSAFRAALDTEYRVERDEADCRMFATKAKDSEESEPLQFAVRVVELDMTDDEGREVTSCVLDPVDYTAQTTQASVPVGKWQRKMLDALRTETDRHEQNVSASGRDPGEARVSVGAWREACNAAGVPKNRFYESRKALADRRIIEEKNGYVTLNS